VVYICFSAWVRLSLALFFPLRSALKQAAARVHVTLVDLSHELANSALSSPAHNQRQAAALREWPWLLAAAPHSRPLSASGHSVAGAALIQSERCKHYPLSFISASSLAELAAEPAQPAGSNRTLAQLATAT